MSDYEIADEIVAFAAEKLLDNYTIEDIASGTVDLSLYPEPIQEVLFKTLNYITNGNLQQSRSNRDGRQYDNKGNAESNLGNVQRGVEKEPGQKDAIGKVEDTEQFSRRKSAVLPERIERPTTKPDSQPEYAGDFLKDVRFSKKKKETEKAKVSIPSKRDTSLMGEKLVKGGDRFLSHADQDLALKNLQEGIKGLGGKVSKDNDAYQIITTLASRNAREAEHFHKDYMLPLENAVVKLMREGSDADEVKRYMKAKRSVERQDKEGLESFSSDPNNDWSRPNVEKYIKDFETKHSKEDVNALWDANKKAHDRIIDIAEEGGKITPKYADNMRNKSDYYVPLRGWKFKNPETDDPTKVFQYEHEESNYQELQKAAEGRSSEADDPLAYTMALATSAIHSANRNKLKLRVLKMWRDNRNLKGIENFIDVKNTYEEKLPDGTWVEREGIPTKKQIADGNVRIYPDFTGNKNRITQEQAGENEMSVYEHGEKRVLVFRDPEMKRVLTGRNQTGQEFLDNKWVEYFMSKPIQA